MKTRGYRIIYHIQLFMRFQQLDKPNVLVLLLL